MKFAFESAVSMAVNADKPHLWNSDVARSIDQYNAWFMESAPAAYRATHVSATAQVKQALGWTANLSTVTSDVLRRYPKILPMLRMSTAPPLARDRLIGLAGVSDSLVKNMEEEQRIPPRMSDAQLEAELARLAATILKLVDRDLFPWLDAQATPGDLELFRATSVVADRLCGATANPIIRNAQEQRQLAAISSWLQTRGYTETRSGSGMKFDQMRPGIFSIRMIAPGIHQNLGGASIPINVPVDVAIMPKSAQPGDLPLLIEAKSAGDITNTNKRRKEEATKVVQLRLSHGPGVRFVLFLCGYFDTGYLGYEAAEGIDWVWEHRIDDLAQFGI